MTQSTRTIAEVLKSREFIAQAIETSECHLSELRGLRASDTICVLGFPQYSLYLNASNAIGGLMFARKFDARAASRQPVVTNGSGERAYVVTLGHARKVAIEQMECALTALHGCLQDLDREELDVRADADAAAYAAEQDYYGMAEERRRHP